MAAQRVLIVTGCLAVGVLFLASAAGTRALWRDAAELDAGVVRSGELSLLNGNGTTQTATYAFNELTGVGLGPGSWSQAPLIIRNGGTADLTYRLASAAAPDLNGLPASMRLSVQHVTAAASCPTGVGAASPVGPTELLYDGPLVGASTSSSRPLTVAAREALCLRVAVNGTAPSAAQDTSTAITFTFAAVST